MRPRCGTPALVGVLPLPTASEPELEAPVAAAGNPAVLLDFLSRNDFRILDSACVKRKIITYQYYRIFVEDPFVIYVPFFVHVLLCDKVSTYFGRCFFSSLRLREQDFGIEIKEEKKVTEFF